VECKIFMLKATKLYMTSAISLGTGKFDALILHKQLKLIISVITVRTQRCSELLFHFINIQPAING
jgi:hypothetical protein